MEWLAHCMEQVVGYVDDVVDRAQPYGRQEILEPFWGFLYCDTCDGDSAVAGACLGVVDSYLHAAFGSFDCEGFHRWTCEISRLGMA